MNTTLSLFTSECMFSLFRTHTIGGRNDGYHGISLDFGTNTNASNIGTGRIGHDSSSKNLSLKLCNLCQIMYVRAQRSNISLTFQCTSF